ncbi:AMP-binding protein [Aequoribacter sp.]|uniref:AMP-binding protein n=1 Tax=Aequoribacter sp. TaxID=2847771 RepID=UPI003F69CEA0
MEPSLTVGLMLEILEARDPSETLIYASQSEVSCARFIEAVTAAKQWLTTQQVCRLGLLLDNEPAWLVWDLAAQELNLCLVPLPTFFSEEQIAHIVVTAGLTHIAFNDAHAGLLEGCDALREHALEGDLLARCKIRQYEPVKKPLLPNDTHKVTFTSGSTGTPKGVCLSSEHCLLVAKAIADRVLQDKPKHLCTLPLSTLLENLAGIYQTWMRDGTVVLLPLAELGFDGGRLTSFESFIGAINQAQPNSMITVPALLMALVQAGQAGMPLPNSFTFVAVGGARVAPSLVEQAAALGLPVYEGYGLSEAASVVSINTPSQNRAGTSGCVLDHLKVIAEQGELVIEGPLFLGYMNQPDSWGRTRYATGDLGDVSADGFVQVSGRKSNLLITTLGRNIAPEWLEGELFASGLFVQCVILGNDLPYCAALLFAPNTISDAQITTCIQTLNARIPDYARVQRWLRLDSPLTVEQGFWTENGRPKRLAIANAFTQQLTPNEDSQ